MSHASVKSAAVIGGRVVEIDVQVSIRPGIPFFTIIGLPDKRIEEAKERVRSAIKLQGFTFPKGTITVNLSPSELRKSSTGFDLAIASALLIASKQILIRSTVNWVLGELSLDGKVKTFQELATICVEACIQKQKCILPIRYTALFSGLHYYPIHCLSDLLKIPINHNVSQSAASTQHKESKFVIDTIKGQSLAKRAIEIACAGGYNILLTGPAGVGKTVLAESLYQLIPAPSREDVLEVIKTNSLKNSVEQENVESRPFRSPHHASSLSTFLGGGIPMKPGEIALANTGVLFLDECTYLSQTVLKALRQPLETKLVQMSKQGTMYSYSASGLVVAACNTCPCGAKGQEGLECICNVKELLAYSRKLDKPFLDRFPIQVSLNGINHSDMIEKQSYKKGEEIAQRVKAVRYKQKKVQGCLNADLSFEQLVKKVVISGLEKQVSKLLEKRGLSGRGIKTTYSLAQTIADLDKEGILEIDHFYEALQYRPLNLFT